MDYLKQMPALAPPAGTIPNFINPESRASMVVITSTVCLVLTAVISSLRFYTIVCIKRSFRPDDGEYRPVGIEVKC